MQELIQYILIQWFTRVETGIENLKEFTYFYAYPDVNLYRIGCMFVLTILAMIITVNLLVALLNIFKRKGSL